ncbi:hypothetical protein D1007_50437 [Hordeum vulgare]|nr:hypothetical protein D1007_50437 [Hordeum vulgare]
MTGLLVFMGVNLALLSTITPVYDFVCFHPYWDRRICPCATAHQLFVEMPEENAVKGNVKGCKAMVL